MLTGLAARHGRSAANEGASAVEFALVMPILILLLFGTIQFGWAFFRWQGIQASSREGARLASVGRDVNEIKARTQSTFAGIGGVEACPDPPQGDWCITIKADGTTYSVGSDVPCASKTGKAVIVTVVYDTDLLIPLWGNADITLSGSGEFRCE